GAESVARLAEVDAACAGALFVCAGAAGAEALAAAGGAGDAGQRETDTREPGHRYSPGGAAFLSSRRVGATPGTGISGLYGVWRRGADYSVEFPPADAGLEDCTCAGNGKYRGAEAGGIHAADGAGVCGDLQRGGPAEGRGEH